MGWKSSLGAAWDFIGGYSRESQIEKRQGAEESVFKNLLREETEQEKRPLVSETERKQQEVLGFAKGAMGTSSYLTESERQAPLRSFETASLQHLARAAEEGTIHSGALGQARLSLTRKRALEETSLQYEDERLRRERLMQIEQLRGVVEQGREKIPTSATHIEGDRTTSTPVLEEETKRINARDKELQNMISQLDKRRPSPEVLRAGYAQSVNETYQELKEQALSEAQRLGMPSDYIRGLDANWERGRERALEDTERFVAALSGPDPAAAQGLLASMYTPDVIDPLQQARQDPTLAVFLAAAGLGIGGLSGPAGAGLGWGIGMETGKMISGEPGYLG